MSDRPGERPDTGPGTGTAAQGHDRPGDRPDMGTAAQGHDRPGNRPDADEPPPFWSRWHRIYLFVAGMLLAEAIAFWMLTRWAS